MAGDGEDQGPRCLVPHVQGQFACVGLGEMQQTTPWPASVNNTPNRRRQRSGAISWSVIFGFVLGIRHSLVDSGNEPSKMIMGRRDSLASLIQVQYPVHGLIRVSCFRKHNEWTRKAAPLMKQIHSCVVQHDDLHWIAYRKRRGRGEPRNDQVETLAKFMELDVFRNPDFE